MKVPRTYLNNLEEAGCRLARIAGTRSGELVYRETPEANFALALELRSFPWPAPELKAAMEALASRIERRFYDGLIKIDRNGYFMDMKGNPMQTAESIAAALEYYNRK